MNNAASVRLNEVAEAHPEYAREAFIFVPEAVDRTVSALSRPRHVSAAELLAGVRLLAAEKFGAVSSEVLASWGIFAASDVGNIVYLLIEAEILNSSPDDRREDFDIDFDFKLRRKSPEIEVPLPFID